MTISEEWRDIKDFEGYQVSNLGRVKRLDKETKQYPDKDGYMIVFLYKNNKSKSKKVHRLVAQAFIPNPNNYPIINHKDNKPDNNAVNNLEWCTYHYNNTYGSHQERQSESHKQYYIAIYPEGKTVRFHGLDEVAEYFNVAKGSASHWVNGTRKNNNGIKLIREVA